MAAAQFTKELRFVCGGEIFLDRKQVSASELATQLSLWKAKQTDPQIFIHGDEATSFKNMMLVLDTVRMLGISKVSMQTRPEAQSTSQGK